MKKTKAESGALGGAKFKIIANKARQERVDNYYLNPLICINPNCSKPIPYEKKRTNKFCGHSCATSSFNSSRTHSKSTKEKISSKLKSRQKIVKTLIKFQICNHCKSNYIWPKPGSSMSYCSKICAKNAKSARSSDRAFNNPNFGGRCYKISIPFVDSFGNNVILDSSYEERLAINLNDHSVKWIRPKPLSYNDSDNIKRKYYPDFYLPEFDVYLDPKNDYLILKDTKKIKFVSEQNNVKVLILNSNQLSWQYIKTLI